MIALLDCTKCAHEYENIQRYEDPNPPCPQCGGEAKRVIGRTTFRCVGGGWANDGYCSRTPQMKEFQRRLKDSTSGRTRGDGKTVRSALRGY